MSQESRADVSGSAEAPPEKKYLSVRQAAFIGVGAMVGAGIFALLGAAGEVAGAAVWLSFLLAGIVAGLQGYSFAKLGARYPSAGGFLEYVAKSTGNGHFTGVTAWLTYMANAIVTAMVAVSFGSYATSTFAGENTSLDQGVRGADHRGDDRAEHRRVRAGGQCADGDRLRGAGDPGLFLGGHAGEHPPVAAGVLRVPAVPGHHLVSVALTFFAFLGFGIITFTAKDLAKPSRQLPKAMFLALGIATVIYVAIALGVFGTLTVDKVISSGGTAIAVAAEPTLGRAGYWLMTVTALFATAGATNAGLYPAQGLSERLAETGQFPPLMARKAGGRASNGLLIQAAVCLVLAVVFNLDSIASIGSAVALVIFTMITAAHLRIRAETGANLLMLILAIVAAGAVFVTFVFTTLIHEPASIITLAGILVLSVALDYGWKHFRDTRTKNVQLAH